MAKTVVEFTLPFVVVGEGQYTVQLNGKVAKITVIRVQNKGGMETVMGLASIGQGGLAMGQDLHGVMNVSKITIELPYILEAFESREEAKQVDPVAKSSILKKECISYMNRLIEVVRWKTRQYWIPSVAPRDILWWRCKMIDDSGKGKEETMMDFGKGISVPIQVTDQVVVINEIDRMLANEERVPLADNLYLDAINYFEAGRFNEAIIVMNVALETLVAGHLFVKLIRKDVRADEAVEQVSDMLSDKFHKVMTTHFKKVDGRSLQDDEELWKKFNSVRFTRKNVIHPRTKKLSEQEAREVMDNITEIVSWVMRGM